MFGAPRDVDLDLYWVKIFLTHTVRVLPSKLEDWVKMVEHVRLYKIYHIEAQEYII